MVELEVEPYESKYFVYYSLENNETVDREPAKEDWDILFTKYIDMVETNEGDFSPYLVTGATSNAEVFCKNFYPVAPDFNDWFPGNFDSTKNAIGYDWKTFDMGSFEWVVEDSNYYFVKTFNSDIYKLQFIDWEGSMTGVFVLDKWLVSLSAVEEKEVPENTFDIYPNPSFGDISIKAPVALDGNYAVRIMDQSGRQIYSENLSGSQLNGGFKLSGPDMPAGIYIVLVTGDNYASSQKLIIR